MQAGQIQVVVVSFVPPGKGYQKATHLAGNGVHKCTEHRYWQRTYFCNVKYANIYCFKHMIIQQSLLSYYYKTSTAPINMKNMYQQIADRFFIVCVLHKQSNVQVLEPCHGTCNEHGPTSNRGGTLRRNILFLQVNCYFFNEINNMRGNKQIRSSNQTLAVFIFLGRLLLG